MWRPACCRQVDALGNPVRLLITPGQQADIKQADALIAGFSADYVIADKGYDADTFIEAIKATKATCLQQAGCGDTIKVQQNGGQRL